MSYVIVRCFGKKHKEILDKLNAIEMSDDFTNCVSTHSHAEAIEELRRLD